MCGGKHSEGISYAKLSQYLALEVAMHGQVKAIEYYRLKVLKSTMLLSLIHTCQCFFNVFYYFHYTILHSVAADLYTL